MLARVQSYLLQGIDALPCEVEVDVDETDSKDRSVVVGLPDAAVKESVERVKSALMNAGYPFPKGRVLVNLAPADVRKEGPVYDLAVALGLLISQGVIAGQPSPNGAVHVARGGHVQRPVFVMPGQERASQPPTSAASDPATTEGPQDEPFDLRQFLIAGELALDGRVRPVKGVIALAALARSRGARGVIVPADNADEASVVEGIDVFGVRTLSEVVGIVNGHIEARPHPTPDVSAMLRNTQAPIDFSEVRGQEGVKRAIVIAAAGGHNLIMLGPPGSGKTMMAKALPGILPSLTPDEAIEITRIYSAAGQLPPGQGLITSRPVRSPHHSASLPALVGGGMIPRPGEISLAHRGVLFLDELPEFDRDVLESLRQPLEDHTVCIARAHSAVRFPASVMLIAAMNPTPKGDVAPGEVGKRAMERYLEKLSGPLLDRIDLHVEAPAVPWKELSRGMDKAATRGTGTAEMRAQVEKARAMATKRQGTATNARLGGKQLDEFAVMDEAAKAILGQAMTELGLSARAYDKIRRVSRTIADLEGVESITVHHVSEAVQYRLLDRKV